MAHDDDHSSSKPPSESGGGPLSALDPGRGTDPSSLPATEVAELEGAGEEELVAAELGALRYVHAAFFAAAILAGYLCGQVLLSIWNSLADWPAAVRAIPQLIQYSEDERSSRTMIVGAVLGCLLVLRYYRKPETRAWANDVAVELSRVTWPGREMVTNGTIVVLIAGAVGTLYVAILDRFWGYLTTLVYGA
jgi:preprotein translocase subunit SecE